MLGYDVSWAAFNIVEVMSSSKFTYKVRRKTRCEKWKIFSSLCMFVGTKSARKYYTLLSVTALKDVH